MQYMSRVNVLLSPISYYDILEVYGIYFAFLKVYLENC